MNYSQAAIFQSCYGGTLANPIILYLLYSFAIPFTTILDPIFHPSSIPIPTHNSPITFIPSPSLKLYPNIVTRQFAATVFVIHN